MSMHQTIRPTLRVMTVQDALSWAFSTEKAALDFDQYGAHEFDRVGVDPIWRGKWQSGTPQYVKTMIMAWAHLQPEARQKLWDEVSGGDK